MVAKIKIGKNIMGILQYNEQKIAEGRAACIGANLYGREAQELDLAQKFKRFSDLMVLRPRAKTNALHISLNFDPSEKLSDELLNKIAEDYMRKIGFSNQPFLVYRHDDAGHPHIHLVTTSIQSDGSVINLHNIGKIASEQARIEIEQEYGLIKASDKSRQKDYLLRPVPPEIVHYGKSQTKRSISNIVSTVVNDYKFTSLPELNAILQQFNVLADPGSADSKMYLHGGLNYFITDSKGRKLGVPIKASAIYQKPTLANLEKLFEKNQVNRMLLKENLKSRIQEAMIQESFISRSDLLIALQLKEVHAIFRSNEHDRTYGLTFVDNQQKVVFNGSDLGKAFTAKAILEKLESGGRREPEIKQQKLQKRAFQGPFKYEETLKGKCSLADDLTRGRPFLREMVMGPAPYDPALPMPRKRRKRKKRLQQ